MLEDEKSTPKRIQESRQASDQNLIDEGAELEVDSQGNEHLAVTLDQIEAARQEMEETLEHHKIIEVVTTAFQKLFDEQADGVLKDLVKSTHGEASRMSVWEGFREQQSSSTYSNLQDLIREGSKKSAEDSLLGTMSANIDSDLRGPMQQPMKIPESVDAAPEIMVMSVIQDNAEDLTDDELEKIEDALKLAGVNAVYKFLKWQHGEQLKRTLEIIADLTKRNPKFNPDFAGLEYFRSVVQHAQAAIRLDFNSKPNYRYAHPEYTNRLNNCAEFEKLICSIDAEVFLRSNNVSLKSNQQETV